MNLTKEEEKILNGDCGKAKQKAMEIVVALGKIYHADCLIPITSAQISGVSYKNLGDAGLEFLAEWADNGGQVQVTTTLNPAGMDLDSWQKLGFQASFAEKQCRVISAYQKFDIPTVCSCIPYMIGNLPRFGEHIAWAESSAVAFANSILGCHTNREGGPSALAAAILGKTANYGFHLSVNRQAQYLIQLECPLKDEADFAALGYWVGKAVANGVPYFSGISTANTIQLKTLGAAMAASGSVALFHIEGITPEAKQMNMLAKNHQTIVIKNLSEAYYKLNSQATEIDLVAIGCPHAYWEEIKTIAHKIQGKKLKTQLWITTAQPIAQFAQRAGYTKIIEDAGGKILSDTCMIVAPLQDFNIRTMATNSGKAAYYAPSHCNAQVRFGNLEACLQAAISGRFPDVG